MADVPQNIDELKIIVYPHPGLREIAQPVTDPADPQIARLVERMRQLLGVADGVGIAAPQLGVALRIFLANPEREPGKELTFINPEIIETEGWRDTEEGCLSLPGITLKLRRRERIRMRYQDLTGRSFEIDAKGYVATILQHEGDHLDGKLIIDRASMMGRLAVRDKIKHLESEFEPEKVAVK
ncbi:MAG: peptide deformylase [Phycisphaerae bacterium]|nr:peptide deformylase [Phycisphaerae bacterium]